MSIYKSYTQEEQENLFSQFLISSWSYSKISEFSRNEKAFEMSYIYGYRGKKSATTIAGQAYHHALDKFFAEFKENNVLDIVDLEILAFEYINEVPANQWKTQKTTPTIIECIKKANKTVTALLNNFYNEKEVYLSEIKEVLDVEVYSSEFLTINGVDIPMPCNARIDLVIKTNDDKIVVIDHKSKNRFSDEQELKLSAGRQAITYVKSYQSKTGLNVEEAWFVENKYSTNRDKSAQIIPFKIKLDTDTKKLYESLLYEPLRRMLEAVNDPDYIYMMNDTDNFVDKAEIYDFWAKTQISEVEDFNIDPSKKKLITQRLKKIKDASIATVNPKVIKEFRKNASQFIQYDLTNKDMTQQEKIEHVLRTFGIIVKVAHTFNGYSSNTFLLEVSAGVKVTSISSNRLDIANALNVSNVRIKPQLEVYQGKSYVSIDFSKKREKDLIFNPKDLLDQKIPIGKDNFENIIHWDLNNHSTPHMLVAGNTGSGKTVSLRSIIEYAKLAKVDRIVILDTKFEFIRLKIKGVEVYSDIEEIEEVMEKLIEEMNAKVKTGNTSKTLVVFDEFADAQALSKKGKALDIFEMQEVGFYKQSKKEIEAGMLPQPKMKNVKISTKKSLEENLRLLLQKGRSAGYRVVAATQRASTKIITGDAKANFTILVCYKVPKEIDSRVVIDESGAEALSGYGDGLIKSPEYPSTVRFQSYYYNK